MGCYDLPATISEHIDSSESVLPAQVSSPKTCSVPVVDSGGDCDMFIKSNRAPLHGGISQRKIRRGKELDLGMFIGDRTEEIDVLVFVAEHGAKNRSIMSHLGVVQRIFYFADFDAEGTLIFARG